MKIWYTATFEITAEIDTDSPCVDADVKQELLWRVKRDGVLVDDMAQIIPDGK